MIRQKNELTFDVGVSKQITLTGYDWRNSILNWQITGSPVFFVKFELLRFKIEWQKFGQPF